MHDIIDNADMHTQRDVESNAACLADLLLCYVRVPASDNNLVAKLIVQVWFVTLRERSFGNCIQIYYSWMSRSLDPKCLVLRMDFGHHSRRHFELSFCSKYPSEISRVFTFSGRRIWNFFCLEFLLVNALLQHLDSSLRSFKLFCFCCPRRWIQDCVFNICVGQHSFAKLHFCRSKYASNKWFSFFARHQAKISVLWHYFQLKLSFKALLVSSAKVNLGSVLSTCLFYRGLLCLTFRFALILVQNIFLPSREHAILKSVDVLRFAGHRIRDFLYW